MKHFKLLLLSIFFIIVNCEKKDHSPVIIKENPVESALDLKSKDTTAFHEKASLLPQPFKGDFLKIENVEINDHQIILSHNEFDTLYPRIDSVKTEIWECGSPFDWLDQDWMIKTYGKRNSGTFERFDGKITSLYTNSTEFNTNQHVFLFNTAIADRNNFKIISNNIVLDQNTTIEKFRHLFPKLKKETTDEKNEFRFRISTGTDGEDSFLFYFKNGRLSRFTLWWLLC